PGQILFLVIGDDTDAQGRGMHWVPFARVVPPVKRMLYSERGGGLSAAATGPFPPAPTPGRVYQRAAARDSRRHASLLGPLWHARHPNGAEDRSGHGHARLAMPDCAAAHTPDSVASPRQKTLGSAPGSGGQSGACAQPMPPEPAQRDTE